MPGRIRTVKPEWMDDQRLSHASSDARVMSVCLILLADDYGNGRCVPMDIGPRVFPVSSVTLESLLNVSVRTHAALCELTEIRYSAMYQVDGQTYFNVRNWTKHQKVNHPGKPLVPPPPVDLWDRSLEDLLSLARDPQERLLPDHDQRPTTNDHEFAKSDVPKNRRKGPSKPKPVEPEPEPAELPGYPELVKAYFDAFERRRGSKPLFGSREGKAVKDLLGASGGDLARARGIIESAYRDQFWGDKATILEIVKDPSKFVGTGIASPQRQFSPPQPNDETNRYVPPRIIR
jgi:hypothetical protein